MAQRVVVATQRWTSRDYGPDFVGVRQRIEGLEGSVRGLQDQRGVTQGRLDEIDGYRLARAQQMDRQRGLTNQFLSSLGALIERVDTLRSDIEQIAARCAMAEARDAEVRSTAAASHEAVQAEMAGLRERHDGLSRLLSQRSLALNEVQRELGLHRPPTRPAAGAEDAGASPSAHRLDELYLQLEDIARGSRETIKQRQSVYLPLVHEVGAGTAERPVLDVGSGRGEWLELLREASLLAGGVDMNRSMVSLCQALGFNCAEGDAVAHLRAMPSNSLGLVSGFHIIEHLSFEAFIDLLDESLRVLAPGGAVLFETPDPANVLVGSHTFYSDPTHRNPMPSAMTSIMAQARGLTQIEIRRLHPSTDRFAGQDRELIDQLDTLFFGPRDYAIIARKP